MAIARSCIRGGSRGRFFNTVDLVNRLEAEGRAGRPGRLADYLTRVDFVILDSCGVGSYVELPDFGAGCAWLPANSSSGYST
jgi:DNA replication protein DnaC